MIEWANVSLCALSTASRPTRTPFALFSDGCRAYAHRALGLFHLAHLRGCLLQPELYVQIAVYGHRVCEMRMGLVGLTCVPVELT